MKEKNEKLIEEIRKVASKRKNPLLVLSVSEITYKLPIQLNKTLQNENFKSLDVLLQTEGGDIDAAFQSIKLLKRKSEQLNMIIPSYAKSAGTLMCLAADNIVMSDISELGPLDTQIPEKEEGELRYKSALNQAQALEEVRRHNFEVLDLCTQLLMFRSHMRISEAVKHATEFAGKTSAALYESLDPKMTGEYGRALKIGQQYGVLILQRYRGKSEDEADEIVQKLVAGYPSHSFVLDDEELKSFGLPIEQPDKVLDGMLLSIRDLLLFSESDTIELLTQRRRSRIK